MYFLFQKYYGIGSGNGQIHRRSYFSCKHRHGVFVTLDCIRSFKLENKPKPQEPQSSTHPVTKTKVIQKKLNVGDHISLLDRDPVSSSGTVVELGTPGPGALVKVKFVSRPTFIFNFCLFV